MVPEGLRQLFEFLNKVGLMDVVLPFIIAFGLLFAIFEKTMVFGRERSGNPKSRVNMMVAGVISLMFVVSLNLVNMMTYIVWIFSGLIMAVILGLIIAGAFGVSFGKKKEESTTQKSDSRGDKSKPDKEPSSGLTSEEQQLMDSLTPEAKRIVTKEIADSPDHKKEILDRVRQAILTQMLRGR